MENSHTCVTIGPLDTGWRLYRNNEASNSLLPEGLAMWLWLIFALIAAVVELVGSGLVFVGIAGAAILSAVVAVFVPLFHLGATTDILLEAAVFALATLGYVVALRPPVLRLVSGQSPAPPSHHALGGGLMGKHAIVTEPVNEDGGQIRLGQGEFWSARLYQGTEALARNTRVEIVYVEGLTALVAPLESVPSPPIGHSSSKC